jgi:hypothetical protein
MGKGRGVEWLAEAGSRVFAADDSGVWIYDENWGGRLRSLEVLAEATPLSGGCSVSG